jgi:hypothetical protein
MTSEADPGRGAAEERHRERRSSIVVGAFLVLVGIVFLVDRQFGFDVGRTGWPLFVIGPGVVLFLVSFAVGGRSGAGFAVAGAIVTATGLILAFQSQTGLWATWAYAWTLVAPGGVGLGLLAYGALTGQRDLAMSGGATLLTGLALFLVFAFFFESVIGLSGQRVAGLDALLAGGIVVLGGVIVVLSLRPASRGAP